MARFNIHFAAADSASPMNGRHAAQPSGAAFIAEYGEGLETGDGQELCAADIDGLAIGQSLTVESPWCDVITITREA